MYQRIADGKVISVKDGNVPYFYVGTDAGKPTPGVGDIAFANDTGKTYHCFVNGVWSLTNSPCSYGYDNHSGVADNNLLFAESGGTATTDAANHEADLSSGLGNTSASIVGNYLFDPTTTNIEFNCIINNFITGVDSNRYIDIGFWSIANEVKFTKTNAVSWKCSTTNGVDTETTDVTIADGDLLTIKNYGSMIMYFINGALVATHKTVTLASEDDFISVEVSADAGASVARSVSVDYIGWRILK